jgi:hypothetical protein
MLVHAVAIALMSAQAAPAPALPLKKLRLYETGVGYFERSGRVDARGASLPIATGHLDDVLKTLVVLSRDAGRVRAVEFNSSVSKGMARTLAGLPADAKAEIGYADLLSSLKGAHVRITTTSREQLSARLVDVVEEELLLPAKPTEPASGQEKPPGLEPVKEQVLLVVSDNAEVRRLRARDVVSVRPTDAALAGRLDAALDSLSAHGAQAERALRLEASGSAVTLGYIGEAPLWRTTYRLVIGEKESALQGWALLHNDSDEDWNGVRVELVNGHPDSFLYPLAAPRYASRELVTPENELSTVPQLLDTTADEIWGDHLATSSEYGSMGSSGGGTGYGAGLGGMGTVGHGSGGGGVLVPGDSSDMLDVGNLAELPEAEGVEAGVLFTYKLADPIHLKARGSALVPMFQKRVEAERITWFGDSAQARGAVRLVNSTEQTLPAGPLSVFAEGGFSGEATLDRLKPGERRIVQFGADLDVELSTVPGVATEEVKRLAFRGDALEEHYLRKTQVSYQLENRSGLPRSVYVALALNPNATLHGADRTDFDIASSHPVVIFELKARSKLERPVDAVEGLVRRTRLTDLKSEHLKELAALQELPEADRRVAKEVADKQAALEQSDARLGRSQEAMKELDADITRLREHLRALGGEKGAGSAAADNPFVQRLLKAEDRLIALRAERATLEAERHQRADAVRAALLALANRPPAAAVSSR